MPIEITAVQCIYCKKLHDKNGRYITIENLDIREHKQEPLPESLKYRRRNMEDKESVVTKDVIVCDNNCLSNYISLTGF